MSRASRKTAIQARSAPARSEAVRTAVRTLDVFEVFAGSQGPLTLTELAGRLDSPLSSCHALVRTLQARGYVYVMDERKRVYPTKRLLKIAQLIADNDPVLDSMTQVLTSLQQKSGETVILGKRQGDAVVYLEVIEGRHTIRYAAEPGDIKPLHSSAIGKAMLSILTPAKLKTLLETLPLPSITPQTLTRAADLLSEIETGRARGWFMTRGENIPDVLALSIARSVGDEWYGVAIAGPLSRLSARQDECVSDLLDAGHRLEQLDAALRGDM